MPRKKLTNQQRLQNVAIELFAKRIQEDTEAGRGDLYTGKNPDARRLYFRGLNDALSMVRVLTAEADSDEWVADVLTALEKQSGELMNNDAH